MKSKYAVSVEKCLNYNNNEVKKALKKSLKNIDFNFKKNMKILIKPNVLMPAHPEDAITTHPIIIEELCKILNEYNTEIYIGDSSGDNTNHAIDLSGIKSLSKYAKIINFEGEDKEFILINNKKIPLPKILFDVDLIINVAKLKTHVLTKATLSVKNLYGCIPGKLKSTFHKTNPQEKDFSKLLYDICEVIKPQLNFIDGILGLEGNGPGTSGVPVKSNILLASRNPYALDIIASNIMGYDPFDIFTNKYSKIKINEISVIGSAKNTQMNFRRPYISKSILIDGINLLFPKPKITFDKNKCTRCRSCERKCPVNAITLPGYPICNHKICIKCLCCIEVCPSNAIYLKESKIKQKMKVVVKKILKIR